MKTVVHGGKTRPCRAFTSKRIDVKKRDGRCFTWKHRPSRKKVATCDVASVLNLPACARRKSRYCYSSSPRRRRGRRRTAGFLHSGQGETAPVVSGAGAAAPDGH